MDIVSGPKYSRFAAYSQRSRLMTYFILFLCIVLTGTAILIVCLYYASGLPFVQPSPYPAIMLFAQIVMAISSIIMIFILVLMYSNAIFTMRRLISHQPALLATEQGIHLRDLPYTGNTFFSWDQVASLSAVSVYQSFSRPTSYLCLYPNNPAQFLSLFHPLRRFLIKRTFWNTGTSIHVPSWFFAEPVEQVLLQIQENLRETLQMHKVQISGTYLEKEEK